MGCNSEQVKRGIETKRRLGIQLGFTSDDAKRMWETRNKDFKRQISNKIWETRRENRTDKGYKLSNYTVQKSIATRKIKGINSIASKKSWETRRRNGTDKLTTEHKEKISLSNKIANTPEIRKEKRIKMLDYIEKNKGRVFCNIGRNETQLLNEQEQKDHCKILRQYKIENLGYIVDGYCPENNTIYEVYEPRHNDPKVSERDKNRQNEIEQHLNCNFVIIKTDNREIN